MMCFSISKWAEIIIVIEQSISPKELMRCQDDYSVNMAAEGSSVRSRGIMVIKKTDKQTKADARKAAIQNWRVNNILFSTQSFYCARSTNRERPWKR